MTAPARQTGRWLGAVTVVGGLTALAWILIPHQPSTGNTTIAVMAMIALFGGMALLAGLADHVRSGMYQLLVGAVYVVITIGYLATGDPASDARLFYIWLTPISAFFFRPRAAVAHAVAVAAVLGGAVWIQGPTFEHGLRIWLMTVGTHAAVGALVTWAATLNRRRDSAMRHAATHDPLTGLPNRTLLAVCTAEALERRRTLGGDVIVMLADLDRFKVVNDTHGHHVGDELICAVAQRLRLHAPDSAVIARLGGDEFAILVEDRLGVSNPMVVARDIGRAFAQPVHLSRGTVHTSASIGVTVAIDSDEPSTLLRNADAAMYRAKAVGTGRAELYDMHHRAETERRAQIEQALFEAIEERQLSIMFLPVNEVDSGRMCGVEALLRWEHPDLGIVHPGEFIHIAEESGLIDEIGEWVIDEALRHLATWRRHQLIDDEFSMHVNVSGAQLHGDFALQVEHALAKHRIRARSLVIELTETVLLRAGAETTEILAAIEELGVPVALDDFGTGFSSLSSLHQSTVHSVKIDQSFVAGMSSDPARRAIVGAIVALTHALDLRVIAEGVDTVEQLDILREMGCGYAQGFHLSPPLRGHEMQRVLTATPATQPFDR